MALLVHMPVTASLHFAVGFGCNHCRDVTLYKSVEQGIGVIPFVSQQRAGAYALHEGRGLGDVRCLASRQNKAYGQTQRICQRVSLATKTATRAARRLGSRVARGRARITVLSMQTFCISALTETLASICSHTPNRLQLENRLNTLFQCPSLSDRSRHWAPERNIHSTAWTNRRQVPSHPIRMSGMFLSLPFKWTHSLSLNLLLSMSAQKLKILLFTTSTEPNKPLAVCRGRAMGSCCHALQIPTTYPGVSDFGRVQAHCWHMPNQPIFVIIPACLITNCLLTLCG